MDAPEPPPTQQTAQSDLTNVQRYFAERKIGHPCPVCRHEHWTVMASDGMVPAVIFVDPTVARIPPPHLPAYALFCSNCGFMEQILRTVVDNYLATRNAEAV